LLPKPFFGFFVEENEVLLLANRRLKQK